MTTEENYEGQRFAILAMFLFDNSQKFTKLLNNLKLGKVLVISPKVSVELCQGAFFFLNNIVINIIHEFVFFKSFPLNLQFAGFSSDSVASRGNHKPEHMDTALGTMHTSHYAQ